MGHEIRVPRLGWSMEEGTFVGWLKEPGSLVRAGEPLFELESEKSLEPVESIDEGLLFIPPDSIVAGSVVQVGTLLGFLLAEGEEPPAVGLLESRQETVGQGSAAVEAPVARHDEGRVIGSRRVASPRARRVASELGVDWTVLEGTGVGGRVRETDVRAARQTGSGRMVSGEGGSRGIPLSPRRRAIASHLRRSLSRTVPVTLTTIADATELVAWRARCKAEHGIAAAYTDIMACLVARVLVRHLHVASRWDTEWQGLVPATVDAIDISIAVDTTDGLLVPVVRDVARRSPIEVAAQSGPLIDRARQGRLSSSEMEGGVFTITNLGAYRIDAFTPVIHEPQIAILGLGAIRLEPAVLASGEIEARQRMTLSLTFDHAALDGAPAAAFLRDVVEAIEDTSRVLDRP